MRLRSAGSRAVDAERGIHACIGRADDGRAWGWLAPQPPEPAEAHDVPEPALLAQPAGSSEPDWLEVLALWPAWCVAREAGLEIGSGVVVAGRGPLAGQVLRLCRVRGALWRAAWDAGPNDVELALPAGARLEAGLARRLPAPPDAVVVLGGGAGALRGALALCRGRGTVVAAAAPAERFDLDLYPDAHRRGLRLVALDPLRPAAPAQWAADAVRLQRLAAAAVAAGR